MPDDNSGKITRIVDSLCSDINGMERQIQYKSVHHMAPNRDAVVEMMETIRSVLFPSYFGKRDFTPETVRFHIGSALEHIQKLMKNQIERGFCFTCEDDFTRCKDTNCRQNYAELTSIFLEKLPKIRQLLTTDVEAAYLGDPAATSPDEAIFCYPGMFAITNYRVAHELYRLEVPLIPRIITEHAHSKTGIDIHPGARIGTGFFIDHGTGVVIGETTIIGNRVRLYQGVTLGAKSFPLDTEGNPIKGIERHPVVEDDVVIYSGATILGRVTIGKGSEIGGNVWLTRDVPAGSRIVQRQSRLFGFNGETTKP